jgi:hypothetical protein
VRRADVRRRPSGGGGGAAAGSAETTLGLVHQGQAAEGDVRDRLCDGGPEGDSM